MHYPSPSFIVLDKATGALLAQDETHSFDNTSHCAESSPTQGTVNGKELIFLGGGDGVCYAFDPDYTPGVGGKPGVLKTVWQFNCADAATRAAMAASTFVAAGAADTTPRPPPPLEVIGTPVFYHNRIYASVGCDLIFSGIQAPQGRLVCIDATGKGDITKTGLVWSFSGIRSSASTVAIANGLLFTADVGGNIFCLDAETGKQYWKYSTVPIWGSPLVADGKVYIPTYGKGLIVLSATKEFKALAEPAVHSNMATSPAVANGVLYVASQRHLYALQTTPAAEPVPVNPAP
jgi:outer membrane protein assembly factor BamB